MFKRFNLRPIESELKDILTDLENQAKHVKGKDKKDKKLRDQLDEDIRKLKRLIKQVPPTCRGYDLGI
jgi:hypothetical protein